MTMPKTPSQQLPDDLEAIARQAPRVNPIAKLRELLGMFTTPLGPNYPSRPADDAAAQDAAAAPGAGVANVTGTSGGGYVSIDGSQILPNSVGQFQLAPDSVGNAQLQANSISANEIQANAITATKIAAGAITADDIVTGTLTGITITGNTITGNNISAGGGGFNGFSVTNAAGTSVGAWDSGGISVTSGNIICSGGDIYGPSGVATQVASGGIGGAASTRDGNMVIDSASSPARFYFRYSGAWHYVTQTAGFTVPLHEIRCPACGDLLLPDDALIGKGDRWQHDGALHGLWIHLRCADRPLGPLAGQYDAASRDNGLMRKLEATSRALLRRMGVTVAGPLRERKSQPPRQRVR